MKKIIVLLTALCLSVMPVSVFANKIELSDLEGMSVKELKELRDAIDDLLGDNSSSYGRNSYSSFGNSYSSYNSSTSSSTDASSIFRNLNISDFSASKSTNAWSMRCKVKNNNSFTVHGYFNVNFYDKSGSLITTELMPLSDIASGETISCSTVFPYDDMNDYSTFDFSQASLGKRN